MATVLDVIRQVFPRGTRVHGGGKASTAKAGQLPMPTMPTDLFAVSAMLIESSGCHYILRARDLGRFSPEKVQAVREGIERFKVVGEVTNTVEDIVESGVHGCAALGALWFENSSAFVLFESVWERLLSYSPSVVADKNDKAWWGCAWALMVISDEACKGLGFRGGPPWLEAIYRGTEFQNEQEPNDLHHYVTKRLSHSMCFAASDEVVCVMPKSRTAMTGCTIRTISHNLAALPAASKTKAYWNRIPGELPLNTEPLNVLLIPTPEDLSVSMIKRQPVEYTYGVSKDGWGEFSFDQQWLPKSKSVKENQDFASRIVGIIKAAETDIGVINAIVFPELALNWETYKNIVQLIRQDFPSVEFMIAGSSEASVGGVIVEGNIVLSTSFTYAGSDRVRIATTSFRGKHHRWKLHEKQIIDYGLAPVLNPKMLWWEGIDIGERRLNTTTFRERSAFTTLICEDLARTDPVHPVLQSTGPNIVFVILMDGPQLTKRWPARYATTLADDPGSSVLVFTSKALIKRQNDIGQYPPNWDVALWKDDTGETTSIACDEKSSGVVLTLSAQRVRETTLDGRTNDDAWSWRLSQQRRVPAINEA